MGGGGDDNVEINQSTWISLLGLLQWYEIFVSVDQTTLWRRHLAWAKTKGKDIRDYTTQRFASNMVFLSLMLGADMNVLFNSTQLSVDIRSAMRNEEYGFKFFIGIVLILSACVAVLGLVATFTAWGMISAISDSNSHCLLRSSMGEYVTSLPSRFVVASLYLFLLWLLLLIAEIVAGPFLFIMIGGVSYLFFQVVISLSAFGRLIIYTGAMGKKRVLDPELERFLLPSGLHASLLIKATERSRRRTSVVSQYSCAVKNHVPEDLDATSLASPALSPKIGDVTFHTTNTHKNYDLMHDQSQVSIVSYTDSRVSETEEGGVKTSSSGGSMELADVPGRSVQSPSSSTHRRLPSTDSVESVCEFVKHINFPRASVLNRAVVSEELKDVVEMALSSGDTDRNNNSASQSLRRRAARRQSQLIFNQESTKRVLMQEWEVEEDVRDMYDVEPPVPLVEEDSSERSMPRPSFLNRPRGLKSLRDLVNGGNERPPLPPRDGNPLSLESVEEGNVRSSAGSFWTEDSPLTSAPKESYKAFRDEKTPLNRAPSPMSDSQSEADHHEAARQYMMLASKARKVFGSRKKKRSSG